MLLRILRLRSAFAHRSQPVTTIYVMKLALLTGAMFAMTSFASPVEQGANPKHDWEILPLNRPQNWVAGYGLNTLQLSTITALPEQYSVEEWRQKILDHCKFYFAATAFSYSGMCNCRLERCADALL